MTTPVDSRPGAAAEAGGAVRPRRDGFLDLVRALALVRVVVWHASGWPVVTVVAAIPVMFFVSGSLFVSSTGRGAGRQAVHRVRRLLPPLWLFAAVSWALMAFAARATGTGLSWSRLVWWLVPLADPEGSDWEGGWLSSPLWYLRAMLWVLLASPVLVRAVRRWPAATSAVLVIAVFAVHAGQAAGWLRPSWNPRLLWQLGDLALFGLFFALGIAHRNGALARLGGRGWLVVSGVAALAAAAWWRIAAPASGVVNDSQPLHLLVGAAWLGVAMAGQGPLRRAAAHPLVRAPVRFLGQRSLTVYLWHAPALVASLALTRRLGFDDLRWPVRYVTAAGVLCLLAVVGFGWVEDMAARRPARLWPSVFPAGRGTGAARIAVAAVVAAAVFVPLPGSAPPGEVAVVFHPRVPSQAPPLPVVGEAPGASEWAASAGVEGRLDAASLDRVAGVWAVAHGIPGVSVAVARPGAGTITAASGTMTDGRRRGVEDQIDVMSVTKLFTANLVYRQVDAGLIDLDAPLPPLDAVPDLPLVGRVTVRQLLSHRSGLANYRDLPRYLGAPTEVTTPEEALRLSTTEVPWDGPVAEGRYSSTNFIVLGYLLEQVTGHPYDELLRVELLEPLGLRHTAHLPSEPGEPRFATAGIVAELDDLGRAALALLRDHVGVSEASHQEMTAIDPVAAMGAGTMTYCPCTGAGTDGVEPFAIGYTGGTTWVAYVPRYDVAIVVDVAGSVHEDYWGPVESLVRFLAEHGGGVPA